VRAAYALPAPSVAVSTKRGSCDPSGGPTSRSRVGSHVENWREQLSWFDLQSLIQERINFRFRSDNVDALGSLLRGHSRLESRSNNQFSVKVSRKMLNLCTFRNEDLEAKILADFSMLRIFSHGWWMTRVGTNR
jgi:hypothetical protein